MNRLLKPIPFGVLTSLCLAWHVGSAAEAARLFSHPDRIRYDQQCLTIDGKDVFIYSGAFHYFRCPKELWRERFQKIKAAGFNCVETYIPWNWCERQMPASIDDFSKVDLADAEDFMNMAESFGLYLIVRPGPYICAEWDTGGFPQWLLTKQPVEGKHDAQWLRGDDPLYLAWCKHWYDAVCPVIARRQITRQEPGQTGVILMQLENEYDFAHLPDDVKLNQIRVLGQTARADGVEVPLITCWTRQVRGQVDPLMRQIFDCCNFYPRWDVDGIQKDIDDLRREQPDAPLATTELQGGWFSKVGEKASEDQDGINAAQINNLTLFAIQNGESILNYYMLFGGANPDDWGARDLTTTYDYNAPIREWGGTGDRYERVRAVGLMLRERGPELARATTVACQVTVPQKDVSVVMRRASDGGRYLFVRTSQHVEARQGTARLKETDGNAPEWVFDYQLEPFGSKVLYLRPGANNAAQGEWLPKPAPAIQRPVDLPFPVVISSAIRRDDLGASHWASVNPDKSLAESGIYDSHFIFYQARMSCAAVTNLLVEYPGGDAVLALVNGLTAGRIGGGKGSSVFALPAGLCDVRLLYENHGHANGGSTLSRSCGVSALRLTGANLGACRPIDGWRMHLVDTASNGPEVAVNFDDAAWAPIGVEDEDVNQLKPNQIAVFRAGLELTATDLAGEVKTMLDFARVDDLGWVFVNGHNVGATSDWSRPYAFDISKELHPGHNEVAVIIQNVGGGGGLSRPALEQKAASVPLSLESFGRPSGDEMQWWKPSLETTNWTPVKIGESLPGARLDSLLAWYRLGFSLPRPRPGIWVPWRLRVAASGNGFLYLNGHALGRYWEAGPQHDFFLPECWLNFGEGRTNNLTLNLRPVKGAEGIRSAIVEPYEDYAESE